MRRVERHPAVIIKGGVRKNLHTGCSVHLGVDALGQQSGRDALGVLVCVRDVAELDDDLAFVASRES